MKDLSSSGKLVISAVHNVNPAARFADFIIVMKEGRTLDIVPGGSLDKEILSGLRRRFVRTLHVQWG